MYVQVKITSQFCDVRFVFDNIPEFTSLFAITEKERERFEKHFRTIIYFSHTKWPEHLNNSAYHAV